MATHHQAGRRRANALWYGKPLRVRHGWDLGVQHRAPALHVRLGDCLRLVLRILLLRILLLRCLRLLWLLLRWVVVMVMVMMCCRRRRHRRHGHSGVAGVGQVCPLLVGRVMRHVWVVGMRHVGALRPLPLNELRRRGRTLPDTPCGRPVASGVHVRAVDECIAEHALLPSGEGGEVRRESIVPLARIAEVVHAARLLDALELPEQVANLAEVRVELLQLIVRHLRCAGGALLGGGEDGDQLLEPLSITIRHADRTHHQLVQWVRLPGGRRE